MGRYDCWEAVEEPWQFLAACWWVLPQRSDQGSQTDGSVNVLPTDTLQDAHKVEATGLCL